MKSTPNATPPANSAPAEAQGALAADLALCRRDRRLLVRLREIYDRLQAETDHACPQCRACGMCCHFDRAGHRLMLTTGELALLAASRPPHGHATGPLRCGYQVGSDCSARDRRPLGCRVFFCCPESQPWSTEAYERHHHDIRAAHDELRLPYRYIELTAALAELFAPGHISVDTPRRGS